MPPLLLWVYTGSVLIFPRIPKEDRCFAAVFRSKLTRKRKVVIFKISSVSPTSHPPDVHPPHTHTKFVFSSNPRQQSPYRHAQRVKRSPPHRSSDSTTQILVAL